VELQPRVPADARQTANRTWQPVRPEDSQRLSDVRQQIHHAVQLASAAGISFLTPVSGDSHTSLEWIPTLAGLFSRPIPASTVFRVGVRPVDTALLITIENDKPFAEYRLHGKTIIEAVDWIRSHITVLGADASHYTLQRHYEIPRHEVAIGDAFDSSDKARLEELSRWFSNGWSLLNSLARSMDDASEVRCWPHHFDIASLIQATPDRTISIGLEPGDDYYEEPYFYVNTHPQPRPAQALSRPLWGRGIWHTRRWVGAVLPGSKLGPASSQERQVREFMDSAISASRGFAIQS
jgi:hypothetical protein